MLPPSPAACPLLTSRAGLGRGRRAGDVTTRHPRAPTADPIASDAAARRARADARPAYEPRRARSRRIGAATPTRA
eukprot:365748-Chlamydomonas_euryale.AAC.2